jgi:LMBR1 domain-containing protein 1
VFAFTLIPFAYFYYEEGDEEGQHVIKRILNGIKFTIFTSIIGVILFVIIIALTIGLGRDEDDALNWLKNLAHDKTIGDKIVSSLISVIAIIGLVSWWVYTGYGLAALPIGLMKGKKKIRLEMGSIADELSYVTDQLRLLKDKYNLTGNKMSKSDQKEFNKLKERQKLLRTRDQALISKSQTWAAKCYPLIYPFKLLTGIVLVMVCIVVQYSFDRLHWHSWYHLSLH